MRNTTELIQNALNAGIVLPGFNIPYIPMMEPVVRALKDTNSVGLIMVARLEWMKFESRSLEAIRDEYMKVKEKNHTRLHLDHVPVIDEDDKRVNFVQIIEEAVSLGYESVMVDGSRLSLDENIECTRMISDVAHANNIPVEAELGAVMGHEEGPMLPYEELYASGKGFTSSDEAKRFVDESKADWLSVAIGNIHGAISLAKKDLEKPVARLNIAHLKKIYEKVKIPLVLHGGSGIDKSYMMEAVRNGIAKINVGTAIRQPYERKISISVKDAQEEVYRTMIRIIEDDLELSNSASIINP